MKKCDCDEVSKVIVGRVTPHIYAFLTSSVPRYLKVGDTYRPVPVRIKEWQKHFSIDEKKDVWDWPANIGQIFFRDYSVHQFLENEENLKRLDPQTLKTISKGKKLYFSNEFFKDAEVYHVKKAIKDINNDHKKSTGKYSFYNIANIGREDDDEQPERVDLILRPNQEDAVKRFLAAKKAGRTNLLMYAVMRFGKSITALKCAQAMNAKFVVIVSGKADVAREWRNTVLSFTAFKDFIFISPKDLKLKYTRVNEELKAKHKVVLFATLQDLQGDSIKPKHEQIFSNHIDLLIIDETHFAARADEYGKPLRPAKKDDIPKSYEKADAEEDGDADKMKEMVKVLDADIRLHLSGTPYRILMGSEFKREDIISFCQFTDIIQAQKQWNSEKLGKNKVDKTGRVILDKNGHPTPYEEWDNPYYGFPQMVRFAFNLNDSARKKLEALEASGDETSKFRELFRTQSTEKDSSKNKLHRKFKHEKEVIDLFKAIGGKADEPGIFPFLKYKKIEEGQMCHHMVCVLPWCASCDALEDLLTNYKSKFGKLGEYKIINISGKDVKRGFVKIADIAKTISDCEKEDKKTLTLTVNRMLTGSTVPEWDTMLFLKDTSSPQEYDQAIFRLQNKFTRIMTDKDGHQIEFNMKPQTLLVDFDPGRMFRLQEARSQYYNINIEKNGNKELENRIARELEVSPIILFNKDKIHRVESSDIMSAISKYSSKRGVAEEVQEIPLDVEVCKNEKLRKLINALPKIGSKEGLTIKPHEGDETGIDTEDDTKETNSDDTIPNEQSVEKPLKEEDIIKQLKTYHALILFYSFLVPCHVNSLDDILKVIQKNSDTKRIAKHLGIEKSLLELYRNTVNWHTLQKLDYKIQNLNHLSEEPESIDIGQEYKGAPKNIKKAIVAMQKFGRLGESKIITPQNIAYDMVKQIPAKEFKKLIKNGEKILDPASKMGEFAIAIVRRCTDPDINLKIDNVKDSILSIPMCEITYEFTRKIYELLELNTKCIALPENLTSYMLRNVKKDNNETLDFVRISKLLTQSKDFDKVTINDNTSNKGKTMSIKIGAVIGNPPYHIKDGGAGASAAPIYPDLYRAALATSARYVSVVIPSRWYAGGKGLDEFRDDMLNDSKIIELHDFPDPNDCFPGLSVNLRGGSCYLLRNSTKRDGSSLARIYTHSKDGIRCSNRALRTPGYDIFLRYEESIPILNKVLGCCGDNVLSKIVSSRKPFGLPTDFYKTLGFSRIKPAGNSVKCIAKGLTTGYVLRSKITVNPEWISRWKVFIPRANNIGTELNDDNLNTFIFEKETVCTESYLVVGGELNLTKKECDNLAKYLHTRFVRCLHGFAKASQDATSKTFRFVPIQDFSSSSDIDWSQSIAKIDEQLYSKYSINKAEVEFIKSLVNPME